MQGLKIFRQSILQSLIDPLRRLTRETHSTSPLEAPGASQSNQRSAAVVKNLKMVLSSPTDESLVNLQTDSLSHSLIDFLRRFRKGYFFTDPLWGPQGDPKSNTKSSKNTKIET